MLPQVAESGAQALKLAENEQFDLAILDMQMPLMDGATLAKALRQTPNGQNLPLILLTSMGKSKATKDFAAVLVKPIKQSLLSSVLLRALSKQSPIRTPQIALPVNITPELASTNSWRILLAEDNLINQKVATKILEKLGYRADVVTNGLEVIDALKRQTYDLVLMDVQMPEMDGLEATQWICRYYQGKDQPWIIALTANVMQGDREKCLAAGMNDFLGKPLRVEELIAALGRCPKSPSTSLQFLPETKQHSQIASPEPSIIDLQIFNSLLNYICGGDYTLLLEMLNSYLDESEQRLSEISLSISQNDSEKLFQAAHSLKSMSFSLGATFVGESAKDLEKMGATANLKDGLGKLTNLQLEYAKAKTALEKLIIEEQQPKK
jgi:CheY-like chemotaxis protein